MILILQIIHTIYINNVYIKYCIFPNIIHYGICLNAIIHTDYQIAIGRFIMIYINHMLGNLPILRGRLF